MAPVERESLSILSEIRELSPDVRLGQLFAHLGFLVESHFDRPLADVDDDEMLSLLYRHRDELLARRQQNDHVSQRIA
jgi:hypothetical protein